MTRASVKRSTIAVAVLLGALTAGCGQGPSDERGVGSEPAAPAPAAAGQPPTPELPAILTRAIEEERGAKASYDKVIAAIGPVAPFPAIAGSEAQHIAALEAVATARGIALPSGSAEGQEPPATRAEACATGVAAERADIALYDELLPQVEAYPDVVRVLTSLRAASENNHLPAFQRCS